MARQSYPHSRAPGSRQRNTHGTSSACSSSVNPDDDWTKISDLAERRRIQNRIAQRNYRKKLKERLEDLERRAVSSSASPPQIQKTSRAGESHQRYKRSPETRQQQPSPRFLPSQSTPPMHSNDDGIFANSFERDGSRTPLLFTYYTNPAPEDVMYASYAQPYRPISSSDDRTQVDKDYLAPVPVSLPSKLQFHNLIKLEYEDSLTPFNMAYEGLPAVDIYAHHGYNDSHRHTPPLSHSYDHSISCWVGAGIPASGYAGVDRCQLFPDL